MHFIEELFGFSPDGGNGLTELLLFVLPVACYLLAKYIRRIRMTLAK